MKGIVFENIASETFLELCNSIEELKSDVKAIKEKNLNRKLTPREASKEFNVTTQTIYAKIKRGELKSSKFGRKILISRVDLEKSLSEVKSLNYKR